MTKIYCSRPSSQCFFKIFNADYEIVSHELTPTNIESSAPEQRKSTHVVRAMKNENNEDDLDGKFEQKCRNY